MKIHAYSALVCIAIVTTSAVAADELPAPKLAIRALQCQPYEYAELNDMPRAELGGAYCGYVAGFDLLKKRLDLSRDKYQDQPENFAALRGDFIRQSERCTQGMEKTADLLSRKFSATAPDCTSALSRLEAARQTATGRGAASAQ